MSFTRPNASAATNTRNRVNASPQEAGCQGEQWASVSTPNALAEDKYRELSKLDAILEGRQSRPDQLIEVLQDMQVQFHYLPEDALRIVAERLGIPLIQVFQVATFYKAFSLIPRGRHLLTICMGTACHVRGAPRLLHTVVGQLNVSPGETTADRTVTLERVNCLGCCALGPVAVLDGVYHDHITPGKLRKLITAVYKQDKKELHGDA